MQVKNSVAGSRVRCPACKKALRVPSEEKESRAESKAQDERSSQSKDVQDYVQSLENQARIEQGRKPYHRGRRPAGLVVGLMLLTGGFSLAGYVFTRGGGLMTTFLLGTLVPVMLILSGVACLLSWRK
jgi:hypothetical protein